MFLAVSMKKHVMITSCLLTVKCDLDSSDRRSTAAWEERTVFRLVDLEEISRCKGEVSLRFSDVGGEHIRDSHGREQVRG